MSDTISTPYRRPHFPFLAYLKKGSGTILRAVAPGSPAALADYWHVRSLKPRMMPLKWDPIQDGPIERVEPACVTLRHELYVFAGYHTLDRVVQTVDVLDLRSGTWTGCFDLRDDVAQTHQGLDSEDDRYIYQVGGQVGIQCSPCVSDCRSLDTRTREWKTLPPLPQPRYAPVTRIWQRRLHVIGGSIGDRVTPACDHWSLAVRHGEALDDRWRAEPPIPRGGPHRTSAVVGDQLFVLGGQEGDRPPIQGDPRFTCDWYAPDEIFYVDSYALETGGSKWKRVADMPIAVTHTEYSTVVVGTSVVILGGLMEGQTLASIIQVYDTVHDRWEIVGRLPWRNKGLAAAYYEGWLYALAGQRSVSRWNPGPGDVLKSGYRTKFEVHP